MRIRQIKPEFFSDPDMAALPFRCRLTYVGLWCCSDDGGYFNVDPVHLAGELFRFDGRKLRERWLVEDMVLLQERGFVEVMDCGHAVIPTLVEHQRFGGRPVYTVREAHARGCARLRADARPVGQGKSGEVRERDVKVGGDGFETVRETAAVLGILPRG